jgi:drug/metabolite transporter (DMT)-like permease
MTRRAWALFSVLSLLWGLPYLLIKVAIAELDPSVIVVARVVMSAVVLLPLALVRGEMPLMLVRWRAVLALATLEIVAPFLLIAYGETHITSALAGLLIAADPLFIALLALRLDRSEGLSGLRLTGLLLGFLGVVALLGLDLRADALGLVGAGLVLLAALCYAGGALLIKRCFSDVSPIGSSAASLTVSAIPLAILAASHLPTHMPSGAVVVSVVVLGLACTAFGFLTYFSLIAEAGATSAALITYVNPAVAVVLGAIVLGERVTPATIAGFVLILVGCWLSTGGTLPRRTRAVLGSHWSRAA